MPGDRDRKTMGRFENLEFGDRLRPRARQAEALDDEALALREADQSLRRGNFEQALRAYARVLEFNPTNAAAWAGQVRMLIELGEFEEAKLWADQAAERFPHEPEVLAAKAVALARTGDLRAALAFSDAAIEERGESPYVWLARGDVLLARAERRATFCFTKALMAGARDWLWCWLASRIHSYYRKFSLALKYASQALTLDGGQPMIWLQLGRCQLALGLTGQAHESVAQARQLDPTCPDLATVAEEAHTVGLWTMLRGRLRAWLNR